MKRFAVIFVGCALALAQTETPPDVKAYREITKETDPAKKIAALEKWKTEFPASSMRDNADLTILRTLAIRMPSQQDRMRKIAADLYKRAEEKDKGYTAYTIAGELLDANVLLKEAESYAKKGVDAMSLSKYVKEQLAGYEKRKQTPPERGELKKRFDNSRALRLGVLGRIEMRLGHTARGKKLLEEANAGERGNGAVLSELGVVAAKSGDDAKALEYLIAAKLSGRATKEAREAFDALYRKQHKGSLDGADAMLDAEYSKRYPNPVKVEAYKQAEKRSDRVVLAELYTGSGCNPCAAADLAFDAALERYSRKDVAVVVYHLHVPRPDPMTTAETIALGKEYDVNGTPTFLIDGKKSVGGGPRDYAQATFNRFKRDIEKDLETPAEAHLTIGANRTGNTVQVNARVFGVESDSKDLKVRIALVEKQLRYNGENGIRFHPMVVRSVKTFDLAGESYRQSFDVAEISKAIKDHLDEYEAQGHKGEPFTFSEKKYAIDANRLAVVVFVHDAVTKHVLQAGYVDLSGDAPHPTLEAAR
jgi:thiol-disulfide isomerase/thioredoxin